MNLLTLLVDDFAWFSPRLGVNMPYANGPFKSIARMSVFIGDFSEMLINEQSVHIKHFFLPFLASRRFILVSKR